MAEGAVKECCNEYLVTLNDRKNTKRNLCAGLSVQNEVFLQPGCKANLIRAVQPME